MRSSSFRVGVFVLAAGLLAAACGGGAESSAAADDDSAFTKADSYSATSAASYAASHWDDGVGLCAEFVSDCLRAGGLDIPVETYVPNLVSKLSVYPFEEHAEGASAVSAATGDVVVFSNDSGSSFCDPLITDDANCGHTCIVTVGGSSESSILLDCHNNAHHEIALADELGGEYTYYRVYHLAGAGAGSGGGGSHPANTVACTTDAQCNGGKSGTGIVCGASDHYCITSCHADSDCPNDGTCRSASPHNVCE